MLDEIHKELDKIKEIPSVVRLLLNLVETLTVQNDDLKKENKALKKELNKLKGIKGPPSVRKQTQPNNNDHSSEKERKKKKPKKKRNKGGSKKRSVKADRKVELTLESDQLPPDAKRCGIKKTLIQDIKLTTDHIQFNRQMYYSEKENKYFIAPLPAGYDGEYGPTLKTLTYALYSEGQMTVDKITWLFRTAGAVISKATVSRWLTADNSILHEEKGAIVKAGLSSTSYQHLDDTSGRVHGQNCFVNVLANNYYSAYFTLYHKDRLSIIEMLSIGGLKFSLNTQALDLMQTMGLPKKYLTFFKTQTQEKILDRDAINTLLATCFTDTKRHQKHRKIVLEAAAIAYYQYSPDAISQLIVDDAPQFKLITKWLGLCWVHEGRHYKKINPVFVRHKKILKQFIKAFWDYYRQLKDYKKNPSSERASQLKETFNQLFSRETGYEPLDKQIRLTKDKAEALLLVLKFPHIPLHNNPAELPARYQARVRDIHLHTMSEAGTKIKDTLATIAATAKKLSVNLIDYLSDRITKRYQVTSLAQAIKDKSSKEKTAGVLLKTD